MTDTNPDSITRFSFEDAPVRGELVRLTSSFQELLSNHHYPPPVIALLGEMSAAASLLADTIKFDGTLTLQIRSEGEIPLIMAEINNRQQYRAIARRAQQASSALFSSLLHNGQLCMTIQPEDGKPYQGIVALDQLSLASSIEAYFSQSEQLATRLWLTADGRGAAGLMLQQMPGEHNEDGWQHLCSLANTVSHEELLGLDAATLLYRLYHQDKLRVNEPRPVEFRCSCDRDRLSRVLVSLGQQELQSLLEEQGQIEVNCEFCNRVYHFQADEVKGFFEPSPAPREH